jgi:hypothetical protein
MVKADGPEILYVQDAPEAKLIELAVGLYQGRGGAGELARAIAEQASATTKRRASEAKHRAVAA